MSQNLGTLGEARVEISAPVGNLKKDFKRMESETKKTTDRVKSMFRGLQGVMAALAIKSFVKGAVDMFGRQEMAVKRVEVALKKQGAAQNALNQSLKIASKLQATTTYGDEESLESLALMINLSGNYKKSIEALSLAQDTAVGTGRELKQVAESFGKAIAGNVEPLGEFLPQIKEIPPELRNWEAAQKILNKQFSGQAAELVDSYTGRLKQLSNTWGDLQEKSGRVVLQVVAKGLPILLEQLGKLDALYGKIYDESDASKKLIGDYESVKAGKSPLIAGSQTERMLQGELRNLQDKIARREKEQQDFARLNGFNPGLTAKKTMADQSEGLENLYQQYVKLARILNSTSVATKKISTATNVAGGSFSLGKTLLPSGSLHSMPRDYIRPKTDEQIFQAGLTEDWIRNMKELQERAEGVSDTLGYLEVQFPELEKIGAAAAENLADAMAAWAFDTKKNFGEVMSEFGRMIAYMIAKVIAFKAIKAGLNALGGPFAGIASVMGNAKGNAFSNGIVTPFAQGGVVSRPTLFPMRNGTGLMGESGPEGILPLKRMIDGALGVRAEKPVVNIALTLDGNELKYQMNRVDMMDSRRGS